MSKPSRGSQQCLLDCGLSTGGTHGRNAYDIKVMASAVLQNDTLLVKPRNRVVLNVDDIDIRAIELFKVRVFEARTL